MAASYMGHACRSRISMVVYIFMEKKERYAASTMQYDFIPQGDGEKIHKDVVYEKEKYPEDLKEPDIELNAAPATRLHMLDFLKAIEKNQTRCGY